MPPPAETRTLSIGIGRDWREVYAFACVPQNFAAWASGMGRSLRQENGSWKADSPDGPVSIRFTPPNELGVLDHYVTLPSGVEVYIPLRVIANGAGSEILLTLIRLPDMDDEKFAADAAWIEKDLRELKRILER